MLQQVLRRPILLPPAPNFVPYAARCFSSLRPLNARSPLWERDRAGQCPDSAAGTTNGLILPGCDAAHWPEAVLSEKPLADGVAGERPMRSWVSHPSLGTCTATAPLLLWQEPLCHSFWTSPAASRSRCHRSPAAPLRRRSWPIWRCSCSSSSTPPRSRGRSIDSSGCRHLQREPIARPLTLSQRGSTHAELQVFVCSTGVSTGMDAPSPRYDRAPASIR
jgi:hypothetical protein